MRVFFSAGEASGDAYAAALLKAISSMGDSPMPQQTTPTESSSMGDPPMHTSETPVLHFEGVGGKKLQKTGAHLVTDSSHWGALGILESIKVAPRVIGGYQKAKAALKKGEPGLFIPIDFGFMNIKLARFAKSQGWKVLYFIPPGSWRKDKQGADLPAITDEIICPFPWAAEILNEMGAKAHFFGHPLSQMVSEAQVKQHQKVRTSIAILPGSRLHEVRHNLPVIAQALQSIDTPAEFAVSSNLDQEALQQQWQKLAPNRSHDRFTKDDVYGVLLRAKAGVICSGTATLEAMLCDCPCVVIYRGSKLMELEYRLRRPKFNAISLPNILLGQLVLQELIQWDATPVRLHQELVDLLEKDHPKRAAQEKAAKDIRALLGSNEALTKSAELALAMLFAKN